MKTKTSGSGCNTECKVQLLWNNFNGNFQIAWNMFVLSETPIVF